MFIYVLLLLKVFICVTMSLILSNLLYIYTNKTSIGYVAMYFMYISNFSCSLSHFLSLSLSINISLSLYLYLSISLSPSFNLALLF